MWDQIYDPLNSKFLSTCAAALPVVTLLVLIASNKVKAHIVALVVANFVAIVIFTMPAGMSLRATILGAVTGFFPIGWIVLNVIFLYRLTVEKGAFQTLQTTIGSVTEDRRLQLLLIAFSFGAFFEGASGFGTPVAVTGAILIGLGFSPLAASGLSLIANTAPVAYGALGTPIAGLASVTDLDPFLLGAMVGRQLPFFSLIVPFWLIWAFAGHRGMKEVWPAILVTGVSFAVPQFLISNFINPWIVDIGASLISMACLIGFLKIWKPKVVWTSPALRTRDDSVATMTNTPARLSKTPSTSEVWFSLLPWIIVCVILLLWGTNAVKGILNAYATWNFPVPGLHNMINKVAPVVPAPTKEAAVFSFTWLSYTGSGMLIAAVLAGTAGEGIRRDHQDMRLLAHHDLGDARDRHIDASVGDRRYARPCIRRHRVPLSLLRHPARLVGSGAHRVGYGVEHPVRKLAKDHVPAVGSVADPDGRRQLLRRCHGQDDRCPVNRRCFNRHQLVRA